MHGFPLVSSEATVTSKKLLFAPGANGRSRELTLATRFHTDAQTLRPYGANQGCTERVTTARTVCLKARRRLGDESADVLPVRQRNCSKVDYCRCPRLQPRL
jgi:hypothetical protein